jgi:diguanylate cyclase (GGDEF)-like protein
MVTSVQQFKSVTSNQTSKKQPGKIALTPEEISKLRLHLSAVLQTTLELPQVLELFYSSLQEHLAIDSLLYRNEKLITDIELGKSNRHSCVYSLLSQQENLGELGFSRGKRFSEQELEILESLINCLIYPVRNALLYREAVQSALRDPLTGAGNRLALENTLDREIALATRHKQPLSILLVDIDKFKLVNDNYGHSAGDHVLKNIVHILGNDCRETDSTFRAYRFGGEEFVLILNNTERTGATIVAERIRQSVEQACTHFQEQAISVTVSVGLSTLLDGDNMASLFSRADKALYQAKNNGRNQVVDWQDISTKTTDLPQMS